MVIGAIAEFIVPNTLSIYFHTQFSEELKLATVPQKGLLLGSLPTVVCRFDSVRSPQLNNGDTVVCDKCRRRLDQRRNEDIWLSRVGVMLCVGCHGEHKGIEVYW